MSGQTPSEPNTPDTLRLACDAMCGGLVRWLRAFGYDTFYREGKIILPMRQDPIIQKLPKTLLLSGCIHVLMKV